MLGTRLVLWKPSMRGGALLIDLSRSLEWI